MKTITIFDRATFSVQSQRQYTDEGFLVVPGRVARTGVQEYLAKELGMSDRKPNDIIKVNRPADSVFDEESLATYNGADITIEHPDTFVDVDTYSQLSAGVVRGAGVQDGDFVLCELIIKDKKAIEAVEAGKVQLSAGYTAEYVEANDNEPFDLIQRNIKINHVALVDRARAGAQARLFDHKGKRAMKITLDSDRTVELEDGATATLISDSLDRLNQRATDAEADVEKKQATIDAQAEEIAELKKSTSDEAVTARIKTVTDTLVLAKKIAGGEFTCDSVIVADIQREALKVVRDSVDWDDKSDIYVQASFDAAAEKAEEMDEDEEEMEDGEYMDSRNRFARDVQGIKDSKPTDKPEPSAYQKFKDGQANAWKQGE